MPERLSGLPSLYHESRDTADYLAFPVNVLPIPMIVVFCTRNICMPHLPRDQFILDIRA